jgi:hypothetical protein
MDCPFLFLESLPWLAPANELVKRVEEGELVKVLTGAHAQWSVNGQILSFSLQNTSNTDKIVGASNQDSPARDDATKLDLEMCIYKDQKDSPSALILL